MDPVLLQFSILIRFQNGSTKDFVYEVRSLEWWALEISVLQLRDEFFKFIANGNGDYELEPNIKHGLNMIM